MATMLLLTMTIPLHCAQDLQCLLNGLLKLMAQNMGFQAITSKALPYFLAVIMSINKLTFGTNET